MRPAERRQAIWAALCKRRHDTAANLASEFGVSQRTIWYDIEELMLTHPTSATRVTSPLTGIPAWSGRLKPPQPMSTTSPRWPA